MASQLDGGGVSVLVLDRFARVALLVGLAALLLLLLRVDAPSSLLRFLRPVATPLVASQALLSSSSSFPALRGYDAVAGIGGDTPSMR